MRALRSEGSPSARVRILSTVRVPSEHCHPLHIHRNASVLFPIQVTDPFISKHSPPRTRQCPQRFPVIEYRSLF
ncbi:hypothetical protein E2C01_054678 [Portunus trituberculatus]|uniref:Uncharacterized protein n=1 Tax=Portunus trituberculatus TaxID=210409 RepID=A0A5B7GTC5_PORTR|nr:hypothetical protein [Portunus trituberculatus]